MSSLLSTSYRTLVKAIMIVLQSQRTSDYIPLKLKKSLRFVNSLHSDMFMVSFTQICSMSFSLYFFLPLIKSAILLLCIHYAIGYIKMVKRNLLVVFIYWKLSTVSISLTMIKHLDQKKNLFKRGSNFIIVVFYFVCLGQITSEPCDLIHNSHL